MDLPIELLEQYQKGRILIFIGQGINGPEWSLLGQELAGRLGPENLQDETTSTEELAELYEAVHGTQALIQTVLEFYGEAGGAQRVHTLLANLNKCRHYVTTCVDQRLEEAFRGVNRRLNSIVRHSDLPYGAADIARLYHLYGTLSQPETLRLTQEQTADIFSLLEEDGLSDVLKGHLADNTIIFVGFDLDDDFFKQLYRSTIRSLHRHHPRSYAFTQHSYREVTRRFCQRNNIEIITAGLDDILSAFIRSLEQYGLMEAEGTSPSASVITRDFQRVQPYKRLLAYQPEDRTIFFGRDEEREQLLSLIHANQLVILYGDSGAGKSSLIGAGLIPVLRENDYLVWSERALESPLNVLQRYKPTLPEPPDDDSLIGLLTCASRQQPLVIIFDQFEEFFTRLEVQERAAFIRELCLALSRRDLPVKWLLAFRSESLARLNEFRPLIPDIFKAEFYLAPLSAPAAAEAISRPAALANLGVEPELQKTVISDLGQQGWISPPQLQIVCYEVYQTTLARQDNTLRLEYYKERGGAREILGGYLEQALRRSPPPAKQVLIALVDGDGLPAVLSVEAVAHAARLTVDEAASLLDHLENEWLVKTVLREGRPHYELAHAYLAAGLAVDPEVLQRKAVEELLHRNVLDWERYRILLSPEELQTVQNWAEKIDLRLDAQKLLLRSAIQRNYQLSYWLQKVEPEIITPILKELLRGSDSVKAQPEVALTALSSIPQREAYKDDLCSLLEELSLSFESRRQATMYLAQMDPALALRLLRNCPDQLKSENLRVIVELYNAQATGQIRLSVPPSWKERKTFLITRLRSNAPYILARTGTAGLAASLGGLVGSIAGYSLIQGLNYFYLFGAVFVPFIWATGLVLGTSLAESLQFNRKLSTLMLGAVIGSLPLAILAAIDQDPEIARQGLLYGVLGALLSGSIMAGTLYLAQRLPLITNAIVSVAGAAIAGLTYSLVFAPLVSTADIPGFNIWSLAGILAGGSVSMMLGLLLVPVPPSRA